MSTTDEEKIQFLLIFDTLVTNLWEDTNYGTR